MAENQNELKQEEKSKTNLLNYNGKMNAINTVIGLYHLFLTIIFYTDKSYQLATYNAASSFFFLIIVHLLIKKKSYTLGSILTFCEISLASFLSTLCTGTETGFAIYNIAAITGIFYLTYTLPAFKENILLTYSLSILSIIVFLVSYISSFYIQPLFPLDSLTLVKTLYISNHIVCAIMIICFCVLLVDEIKSGNKQLEIKYIEINELSLKDPLTHLNNRKSMSTILNKNMTELQLSGKRFCIAIGDIDNFKYVNDNYGHEFGDKLLQCIAERISNSVRDTDSVCRWGGDEFLFLINESIESASMVAERVRSAIESEPFRIKDQKIELTITFGVCESVPGYKLEQLIGQATDNLHEGKANGKNQVIS